MEEDTRLWAVNFEVHVFRFIVPALLVYLFTYSQIRAEEIIGKVHSIDAQKRCINLDETGNGKNGNVCCFRVNSDARIEEWIGEKSRPLPNGLKDICVGDYLVIASNSRGVFFVQRLKKDPRKQSPPRISLGRVSETIRNSPFHVAIMLRRNRYTGRTLCRNGGTIFDFGMPVCTNSGTMPCWVLSV